MVASSSSALGRVVFVLALGVLAGCFSEPSSVDTGASATQAATGDDATDTGSSSGSTTMTAGTTGNADSTGPAAGTSSTAADTSSGSGSSDATGACGDGKAPTLMWAEDAVLVAPMELVPAPVLPGEPMAARSYAGGAGTIAFTFELPCATTVEIHALVRDAIAGVQTDDPDSYFVSVDGEPEEETWTYGCATGRLGDDAWLWERLAPTFRGECDAEPLAFDLDEGPHELVLRNRESGGNLEYAAIAAVVVTDDPAFDPKRLYDPAP